MYMMTTTTRSDTTVTVEEVDMKHLAQQAMTLYSQRYGKMYDTHVAEVDVDKRGCVTYKQYMEFNTRNIGAKSAQEAHDTAHKQWLNCTGGCPPREVDSINRQQCIDLMIKGFHSPDSKKRENWKKQLTDVGLHHFDMMDLDGDGYISKEEWKCHKSNHVNVDGAKGGFDAMDLNGDGVIDKHEWLTCHEGFFLSLDEERFHHFFGKIDY